jgi:carotenoid 1,2-hydratase
LIPTFDQPVEQDGYAWWYLDAISDDGRYGVTLIAFIGSVFSPYYAWQRARVRSNPLDHCAVNVALYGPHGRWCMTERNRHAVRRDATMLKIGPSGLKWKDETLLIDIDEWAVPVPRRICGQIRVRPTVHHGQPIELDRDGRHIWTPVMPAAQIDVVMETPGVSWSGTGYFDHNTGTEPLEKCFDNWFWLRASTSQGPVVLYDSKFHSGERSALALRFDPDGERHSIPLPEQASLPRSRWGVARPTRSDDGEATLKAVWEDTPFYTRSLVSTRLLGEDVIAVHESLSLNRFSSLWVQALLPFRMPRHFWKARKQV